MLTTGIIHGEHHLTAHRNAPALLLVGGRVAGLRRWLETQ